MAALEIIYSRRAIKDLRGLPPIDRQRVVSRLKAYAEAPSAPSHDVIHLVGTPDFRLRFGDWRVVFHVTAGQLDVSRIGHRREVYR